ncbi:hypothetical protein M752DRAFT_95022 [Aspergillus phoenicis ATCC 13157]|uniref:Uncharacterized protein n=1 Tax=Aspergillus phoenicis ATCC 13157 TaxID=1353007 RepID=A0A370P6H0_ASPPH|nr:hypothetical protein M752DRAFT_95022 [Aspergillus phoenicis ATCC 13157]
MMYVHDKHTQNNIFCIGKAYSFIGLFFLFFLHLHLFSFFISFVIFFSVRYTYIHSFDFLSCPFLFFYFIFFSAYFRSSSHLADCKYLLVMPLHSTVYWLWFIAR